MITKELFTALQVPGNKMTFLQNKKHGPTDNIYGIRPGVLRKRAKKFKIKNELALSLWSTAKGEARFLAILILQAEPLSTAEMDHLLRSTHVDPVTDWLNSYVVKHHPGNVQLRHPWMASGEPVATRAGWKLMAQRIAKILDFQTILDRINCKIGKPDPLIQ